MTTPLRGHLPVVILLAAMALFMVASSWNDSAIIDELAHIPAGYSYVFLRDYRLNPEHPPLIKDLAALPLAFSRVHFPTNVKSWTDDINGQWAQGALFLYESGNDPDTILHLMRVPEMALAIVFGYMLWRWTRRRFGRRVALLTLFLFTFSPTFIAHSRFVTTDLAAAFGFFIGITTFLRFLEEPTRGRIALAGLAFGAAELFKFSTILLVPIYGLMLISWAASRTELGFAGRWRLLARLIGKTVLVALVGVLTIWAVYAYHTGNYPAERHMRDAEFILTSFRSRALVSADLWLIGHAITRPLGQYLLGLLMVLQRAAGGNTQYFLGDVSAAGSRLYFPLLYLLKEPLAFHVLSLIALFAALRRVARAPEKSIASVLAWVQSHMAEVSATLFIAVYWLSSVSSTLNIGVRHVLPTFPFLYLLVASRVAGWLRPAELSGANTPRQWLAGIWQTYIAPVPRYLVLALLVLWQVSSVTLAFPHYLSYFNELGGGVANGYQIAVDSNYDWGQDLKRLTDYVNKNNIQKIALDYFGGGSPRHELGEKLQPWASARGYPPNGGWFAVSATFQMGAYGRTITNFQRRPQDSYEWLKPFRPVARAGTSIFIYNLPPPSPLNQTR